MRLKYSKARKSSWATPLPSAYIRPSFHCAIGWPPSAAYCSEVSEESGADGGIAFFRAAAAPGWPETTGIAESWLTGAPSNANTGPATGVAPKINAKMIRSDIRITLFLVRPARMGYGAIHRRPDLLGVFPQHTRFMIGLPRLPFGLAFGQFGVGQLYVKSPGHGVDFDDVTVAQQCDRPAHGRFRPDMADAEPAGGTGEPAIGDQRDLAAHAPPGQRRGRRQHFPHAGAAARPLIADHDDLALFVGLFPDRLEGILFAIEAAGRP